MDEDTDTLANRFVLARKEAGYSQVALSQKLNVSQQSIEKLENGYVRKPKYLPEAARALEVNYDWLLNGLGPQKASNDEWIQGQLNLLRNLDELERDRFEEGLKFMFPEKFKEG